MEMNSVFAVYGIEVSKRHLSLTADHMTFTGQIAPFNRGAMSSSSSPLQKMTFETTMAFMKEALLHGKRIAFILRCTALEVSLAEIG
ncbi:unnamed protein product [Nippostrongylus brasiliensis]|uniref:DNA-directed RNA polymerase n=1 Tax=Nippostrongylus brasiliensis TaxID=27835 RepID=A0A0N4XWU1_NIPBR|nr:unnamed protein product [Nippostrongylus brasiliensis]